jgi:hypothetical protein
MGGDLDPGGQGRVLRAPLHLGVRPCPGRGQQQEHRGRVERDYVDLNRRPPARTTAFLHAVLRFASPSPGPVHPRAPGWRPCSWRTLALTYWSGSTSTIIAPSSGRMSASLPRPTAPQLGPEEAQQRERNMPLLPALEHVIVLGAQRGRQIFHRPQVGLDLPTLRPSPT